MPPIPASGQLARTLQRHCYAQPVVSRAGRRGTRVVVSHEPERLGPRPRHNRDDVLHVRREAQLRTLGIGLLDADAVPEEAELIDQVLACAAVLVRRNWPAADRAGKLVDVSPGVLLRERRLW
jgi:hypothetical protein